MARGAISASVDERISQSEGILKNILDQYTQYEYHFRLYLVNPQRRNQPTDRTEEVVIAETAASTIAIENVKIFSVGGMNKQTGVGLSTKFELTLKQPFGATLIDVISDAAISLGIPQLVRTPFYLELTFRARDPDTQKPIENTELANLRWVWPVLFTNTSIDVASSGSVYTIMAVLFDDSAFFDVTKLKSSMTIKNVRTVKDFFDGFAVALNKREDDSVNESTKSKPNRYSFDVSNTNTKGNKRIGDLQISAENITEGFFRDATTNNDGGLDITIPAETNIETVVRTVLSATEYFQEQATANETPDNTEKRGTKKQKGIFDLFRVIGGVEITEFDFLTNNYSYDYKYEIVFYEVSTILVTPKQLDDVNSEQEVVERIQQGKIRKVYNHLFTGLNDQVLDFNLQFNFNWYIALPWQGGKKTQSDTADSAGEVKLSEGEEESLRQITARASSLRSLIDSEVPFFSGDRRLLGLDRVLDLPEGIPLDSVQFGSIAPEILGVASALERSAEDARALLLDQRREQRQREQIQRAREDEQRLREAQETWRQIRTDLLKEDNENPVFAEQISERITSQSRAGTLINPPVIEDHNGQTMIGLEGSDTPGRAMLSSLFEQLLSPLARDLVNIELKVKGDPFWLEPDPVSLDTNAVSRFLGRPPRSRGATNNSTYAQTYFLFRSFLPDSPDPSTGKTPGGSQNTVINGLYFVKEVVSEFSNGTFTQTLNAIRDLRINTNDIDFNDEGIPVVLGDEVEESAAVTTPDAEPRPPVPRLDNILQQPAGDPGGSPGARGQSPIVTSGFDARRQQQINLLQQISNGRLVETKIDPSRPRGQRDVLRLVLDDVFDEDLVVAEIERRRTEGSLRTPISISGVISNATETVRRFFNRE